MLHISARFFPEIEDNNIQMKKDLQKFVYYLRINAEVHVIEMVINYISVSCSMFLWRVDLSIGGSERSLIIYIYHITYCNIQAVH